MLQVTAHDVATDVEKQDTAVILSTFLDDGQVQFLTEVIKCEKALIKLPKLKELRSTANVDNTLSRYLNFFTNKIHV